MSYLNQGWHIETINIANNYLPTHFSDESLKKIFDYVDYYVKKNIIEMKVIFLHGYGSTNKGEKYDEMRKYFTEVISPKIDWQNKMIYEDISNIIKQEKPDLIIGSSMGGYLGYHLGNEFNIQTLLFNPAFHSRPVEPIIKESESHNKHTIILGSNDDVIDPRKTLILLENQKFNIEPISHRIPLGIFRKWIKRFALGETIIEKFSMFNEYDFLYEMNEKYGNWQDRSLQDITDEELKAIWNMYTNTYGKQGMDFSADNRHELKTKYHATLLNDVDNDGTPDAFIIYRATKWGNKIALLGTNDKKEAKREFVKKLIELVNTTGWFIEASKKLEDILKQTNAPIINDWTIIQDVIGQKKEPIPTGDGYYTRKLSKADKRITKRMYGIPYSI